jgi:hypothetical protein
MVFGVLQQQRRQLIPGIGQLLLRGQVGARRAGVGARRGARRRFGQRVTVQPFEHLLAVAVAGNRVDRGLHLQLQALEGLQVARHLRGQGLAVLLAERLDLAVLLLQPLPGLRQLVFEEAVRGRGERGAVLRVLLHEQRAQFLRDGGGHLRVPVREAHVERRGPVLAARAFELDGDVFAHAADDVVHRHHPEFALVELELGDQLLEIGSTQHLHGDRIEAAVGAEGDRGAHEDVGHTLRIDGDEHVRLVDIGDARCVQQRREQRQHRRHDDHPVAALDDGEDVGRCEALSGQHGDDSWRISGR